MGDATSDDAAEPVDLRLADVEIPLALARLHHRLASGPPTIEAEVTASLADGPLEALAEGAGFELEPQPQPQAQPQANRTAPEPRHGDGRIVRLGRVHTLSDTVGPDMRLLVCGLNPSPYSAEIGVGFGRPGNRFWPAVRAAGLITIEANDPIEVLTVDRMGMTDLVKRVTRRADELTAAEYRRGLDRVDRLVAWLEPMAVCFVGLAGWRAAVDGRATAGVQERLIGNRPVYLMPSTSGLNAHATVDSLTEHLRNASHLADESTA